MADLVTPMSIRVAATLRVAEHLAHRARTAAELAEAVDADAEGLDRVLGHLVAAGLFVRDGDGRWALGPRGGELRDEELRRYLDIDGGVGRGDLAFMHLLHTVRTGEPAFPASFGASFWDDLAADPERTRAYAAEMGADAARWAPAIAGALDWGALGHLVDVGGGNGALLRALLTAHPGLRGTVVDLPGPVEVARRSFGEAGLGDRAGAVAGSFFDPLPAGAGGYLLCAIVHDWDDASAGAILHRCAEAAGPGGRVFVVEKTGPDGETVNPAMSLRMLVYFGGKERGLAEFTALAADAGLRVVTVHAAGDTPVIELTPL